ncbi:TonB-dependent receptor domain-containing protein, partial [Jiella pacifica]
VFNTSEDTFSALAKGTVRWGEDHSLELGYVHFESDFGESMGSLLFQQDDGFRQVKLSEVSTDTLTARYHWDPVDDMFDLRFNVWASKAESTTRAVAAAPDFSQWGIIPADEPRYTRTWTYGADVTNTSRFDLDEGRFRFDYGLSYLVEDAKGDEYCSRTFTRDRCVWLQPSVGTRDVGSVFSRGEWEVTDWLKFDAGLRYDFYRLEDEGPTAVAGDSTRDGGRLNPSLGVTLTPLEGLQLFARYAEGVRPPTLRETMGSDANAIPNPDLEPETTKSTELGFNVLRNAVLTQDDKVRLKVAYFHNDHDDYISRVPSNAGPGQYVFTFDNIDKAMFEGIEVSGGYDAGIFFTDFALTHYTDYEFCRGGVCGDATIDTDYAVAHIPAETSLSLTMGTRLFEERLVLGGRVTYAGSRLAPLTSSDRQRTPFWLPYTTVDAFASYEFNDNLTFDMQAENLFDRYYVDAQDGWVPAPGRTIRANVTAKF